MPTAFAVASDAGTLVHDGVPFLIKIGELSQQCNLAMMTYTTAAGEEPPLHTHPSEHEIFVVLAGQAEFVCAAQRLTVASGGLVFLPATVPHTYIIPHDTSTQFLVITVPAQPAHTQGWGGFIAELEQTHA
jgi:quercetin dioxygenase-like cupin family protein